MLDGSALQKHKNQEISLSVNLPQEDIEKGLETVHERRNKSDKIKDILAKIHISESEGDSPTAFGTFRYYHNSNYWNEKDKENLLIMTLDALSISRKIFFWFVDNDDIRLLEDVTGCRTVSLGFNLTRPREFCASYHISILHGEIVYFCRYLEIDYIFKKG